MAPPPRLRILSGECPNNSTFSPLPSSISLNFSFSLSLSLSLSSFLSLAQDESSTKTCLYSRWKRHLGLPLLAITGYHLLRCHSCLEIRLWGRFPIWCLLQVRLPLIARVALRSILLLLTIFAFCPLTDQKLSAMNGSNPVMVWFRPPLEVSSNRCPFPHSGTNENSNPFFSQSFEPPKKPPPEKASTIMLFSVWKLFRTSTI